MAMYFSISGPISPVKFEKITNEYAGKDSCKDKSYKEWRGCTEGKTFIEPFAMTFAIRQ